MFSYPFLCINSRLSYLFLWTHFEFFWLRTKLGSICRSFSPRERERERVFPWLLSESASGLPGVLAQLPATKEIICLRGFCLILLPSSSSSSSSSSCLYNGAGDVQSPQEAVQAAPPLSPTSSIVVRSRRVVVRSAGRTPPSAIILLCPAAPPTPTWLIYIP